MRSITVAARCPDLKSCIVRMNLDSGMPLIAGMDPMPWPDVPWQPVQARAIWAKTVLARSSPDTACETDIGSAAVYADTTRTRIGRIPDAYYRENVSLAYIAGADLKIVAVSENRNLSRTANKGSHRKRRTLIVPMLWSGRTQGIGVITGLYGRLMFSKV